jgi:hypothetical protein
VFLWGGKRAYSQKGVDLGGFFSYHSLEIATHDFYLGRLATCRFAIAWRKFLQHRRLDKSFGQDKQSVSDRLCSRIRRLSQNLNSVYNYGSLVVFSCVDAMDWIRTIEVAFCVGRRQINAQRRIEVMDYDFLLGSLLVSVSDFCFWTGGY